MLGEEDGPLWDWLKFFRIQSCLSRDGLHSPPLADAVIENTRTQTSRQGWPSQLILQQGCTAFLAEMPGIEGLEHVLVE